MKEETLFEKVKSFFGSFFSFYRSAEVDLTSVAVAYYLLISGFPILLTLANLLPYFPFDVEEILAILKEFIPSQFSGTVLPTVRLLLTQRSSSWLGISIMTTLWTVSKSMMILQKAVNKAYGVTDHRNVILARIVGVLMGLGLQTILILSITLLTFGQAIVQFIRSNLGIDNDWLLGIFSQVQWIAYLALAVSLIMFYYVLPNVKIPKLRYVLPGPAFVLGVFIGLGNMLATYVQRSADKMVDVRLVTSLVFLVVMIWFILLSHLLIVGAVLNATVQSRQEGEFEQRSGDMKETWKALKRFFIRKQST